MPPRYDTRQKALDGDMTPRQRDVFIFIDEWWRKFGYGPSVKEIKEIVGINSTETVTRILNKLVKMGFCKKIPYAKRSIRPAYFRNTHIK